MRNWWPSSATWSGRLEDDGTGLDDCIRLYERGAVLVRQCEELLTTAELKISELGRD